MAMPQWTRGVTAAVALSAPLSLMALLSPASAEAAAPGAALRVLTPRSGDALGSATFNLDVSFQAAAKRGIVAAEVWVDGVRWLHRDLDQVKERGVLSFAIDASTLSEGEHAVVVNVLDTSGSWTSTSVNVIAGNNAGTESGTTGGPDIRFNTLQNGKSVSSTVDVSVDASSRDGKNPYVSFFINKEFKTLKNYPPYSYTWDTTTVENGWHTIEALGFTDDQSKATTTRRIRVYVDNPGGNTTRQGDIPDLKKPDLPAAVASQNALPEPRTGTFSKAPLVLPTPGSRLPAPSLLSQPASPASALPMVPRPAPSILAPAAIARQISGAVPVQMAKADFPRVAVAGNMDPVASRPEASATLSPAQLAGRTTVPGQPGSLSVRVYPTAVSVTGVDLRVAVPAGMAAAVPVQATAGRQEVRTAPLHIMSMVPTAGAPALVAPAMPAARIAPITGVARTGAPVISASVTPSPVQMASAPIRIQAETPASATPAMPARRAETAKPAPVRMSSPAATKPAVVNTTPQAIKPVVVPTPQAVKPIVLPTAQQVTAPKVSKPAMKANSRSARRLAAKNAKAQANVARPADGPIQIAFDGDVIAFDVQPRVEAGLPLAPFRQIFEHTGGQVTWVPSTRVVRAINAEREIVLRDGQKDARVNDETVRMEQAMFIERGRTIVPLSFVGKALDVNVQYDPATGRLQITSK